MRRARTLLGWLVVVLTAAGSGTSSAQDSGSYPARPVTVVIPTAASVSGDILMRAFGDAVSKHLGQPIVVENKPGGSGALAAAYVATSVKSDGYTLLNITIPMYRVPFIQKTPYDPVKDFTPIILLGGYTLGGVVKADSPFKEWKDVLEFSKANPGRFTYTTVGPQTTNAIAMETMARHSGVQFTHVPRRLATAVPAQLGAQQEVAERADHQARVAAKAFPRCSVVTSMPWWKARLGRPS
jgi:tripartite-type tricarboxylate transporter receptor subunit TctC